MSSSLARSACGKAGSSFSSRWDPSPWPCSSVGLTGEFSLDELGDDVWNEMGALQIQLQLWMRLTSKFIFLIGINVATVPNYLTLDTYNMGIKI